jgi:hypothetical protein
VTLASVRLWLIVCGVVVLTAAYLVYRTAPSLFEDKPDPRSVEFLGKLAQEINRSVPVMIDQETELMPVTAAAGTLIYNYRLVNYSATQVDSQKFREGAQKQLSQTACTRPETREDFLKKGVTLRYSYFDKDRQHIATIDVTPSACGF